jgi:hypothetical protein
MLQCQGARELGSQGSPWVPIEPTHCRFDPADVLAHRLSGAPHRQDKLRIVGLGAHQVIDHQVAAAGLDDGLEPFHRAQQIGEIFGLFLGRHLDSAPVKPGGNLLVGRGQLLPTMP